MSISKSEYFPYSLYGRICITVPSRSEKTGVPGFAPQSMAVSLLLISLLLTAAAFGSYRVAQEGRAFRRAAPQGGITTAFDFSESTSPDDESDRFLCTIRNERFAQEFARLNSKHICTTSGPSAR